MVEYGQILRLLRKSHNLSLEQLANKLNITKSHISKLENNKSNPSIEIVAKYAKEFNIKPSLIHYLAEDEIKSESNFFSFLLKTMKTIDKWGS